MKTPFRFPQKFTYFLLSSFFFLVSCSKFGDVSVSSMNFEDEVQLAQNLVFTFSQDLVREGDLNTWESEPYIEFSPKVEGKYKWTATNELVFSPAVGFEPATEYTATISKSVMAKSEKKVGLSADKITFHTPYLKLENVESFWTKSREDGQGAAVLKLNFNYPVNPQEVAKMLTIKDSDDKKYDFSLNQTGSSQSISLKLKGVSDGGGKSLKITLEKGLSMPNSKAETAEEISLEASLPDIKTLEITDVQHSFENNQGYVKVITNQAISVTDLQKIYKIEINGASEAEDVAVAEPVYEYDSLGNPIEKIPAPVKAKPKTPTLETKAEITENGFLIRGDFNETDNYVLTINKEAKGVLGASLSDNYTKDLYFGTMPASIGFVNKKAIYLSSKGNKNIAINVVNTPKVNVRIAKIYENNILHFLKNGRYQNYDDYSDEEGTSSVNYDYDIDESGQYSDVIVNKTVETANLAKSKNIRALNLSLPEQNGIKGIYIVSVNSNDEYYNRATKLVSISDIGMIMKSSENEVVVFTNSIKTAEPMSGVEVSLISTNNQTIQTVKSDGKGMAIFKDFKATKFNVAMITAHTEDDFNYLFMEGTNVETSRFDVEGKRDNTSGFEAFIYGDRDIYRPGETLHFNTIIRKNNWESVGEIPVKIRLLLPNGKEFKTFKKTTNAQGAVDMNVPTDRASITGVYVVEVLNANDVLLASRNISIEEFMPDRIKVDVKAGKEFYRNGETIQINATALNLFGPPASNRNYQMELNLNRKLFEPKGYNGYVFDINDNTNFEMIAREGVTNENGLASESFQIPATYSNMGVLEAKAYVTVFDETGRPVNRLKKLDIFTQSVFYGIGMPDTYIGTNVPSQIPLVALNKDGQPTTAKGRVEIVRFDYQTVIEKNSDNSLKYSSKKQTKVVYSRTMNFAGGKANVSFAPPVSGEYEIRVHSEGAKSWTAQYFYAYGYGATENSSFEVNNEGKVDMEFDKEKYEVGDKAKVLFKTPFAGKLIVTIERNHVLENFVLETDKKSAELIFTIGKEHLPNVYVSATLIRPMDGSNMPLTVAHGYAPVMVEDADTKLPIEIVAVEKSRSKTKQKITIKTNGNTEVTIAVVDEGILQLKNFKTPDPHAHFYQKQALEVNSYDLYPFLFPELSISGSSSIGGDGYDMEKRVNPLNNGRVNLVAIWSGIVKTGIGGEATFEFDIPQFSGDLRIMAVAYKDEAFGSANKNMKVADPLVISTALPRFASPNDEIQVPVNITNTTKQAANVTATVSLSGGLSVVGSASQTLMIPAEKEGRAYFAVKAAPSIGNATVNVVVSGLKEKFTEKIELTVRPTTSLMKTFTSGVVNGGAVGNVDLQHDFIPSSIKSEMTVSKSPMVQFMDKFQHLLAYPHGCVEQTTSAAFPQLYFSEFVKQIQSGKKPYMKTGENELNPRYNVEAAIHKLETMQLPSGGMSYWQGGDRESWWGTAYATHFMLEAQKNDFQVNSSTIGKLIEYLTVQSNSKMTDKEYYYLPTGGYDTKVIAARETIYSLYVLALAGKPNRSVMNYYKSNIELLTSDSKYLLAAAYSLIGEVKSYNAILPKNYANEITERWSGGSFSSPIRNQALVLNTLVDTDPNNIQIPLLARQLSINLKAERWLTTQEEAFAFLALGKLAKKANNSNITASISSNNKVMGNFTANDLLVKNIGNTSSIRTQGKGSLYYFAQAEGLSATGKYEEIDNILKVRKQFYTRSGQPLGGAKFKQNQLIVVKITLQSTNGLAVDNVVVTDMLPAGVEIENPRLTADRDLVWVKDQTTPEHFDIRDDRINFFTNISNRPQTFYYLVRAVSKGKFQMGPVSADAMYRGEYRSYSGGGVAVVE
jgi:alpha-2-macroglobulin